MINVYTLDDIKNINKSFLDKINDETFEAYKELKSI